MSIAQKMEGFITRASWIRKMFEEGEKLKKIYGVDQVFDFSLGNPNLEPPDAFFKFLEKEALLHKGHGYMPNAGFEETREVVANYLKREHNLPFSSEHIVMTCGAAGAINIALKALLDPGDEIIVPAPYFVEYNFYIDNHNGVLKVVPTKDNFDLDLEVIAHNITIKTKAILLNSPNNPTGQIYSVETLKGLAKILEKHVQQTNRIVYIIMDEPYHKIVYDNYTIPSIFQVYPQTLVANSFSKSLSIPGERIGYLAVNPEAAHKSSIIKAAILANRILGFVNAPALMQRVIMHVLDETVDVRQYQYKRDLLCEGLSKMGFSFIKPKGAFYLFPKSPILDDIAFVEALKKERILAAPGSGFAAPGYFRLSFCVEISIIENALPYFENVARAFNLV